MYICINTTEREIRIYLLFGVAYLFHFSLYLPFPTQNTYKVGKILVLYTYMYIKYPTSTNRDFTIIITITIITHNTLLKL